MSSELKDEFRRLKEDDDNASKPISKPKIGHRKHLDSLCSSSVEHDDSSSDSTDVRSKFVIDTNKVGEGRSQLIRNGSKSYQAFGVNKVLKTEAKRIVAKLGNYFDEDLLEQESDNEKPVEKEDPADDESFVIDSVMIPFIAYRSSRRLLKKRMIGTTLRTLLLSVGVVKSMVMLQKCVLMKLRKHATTVSAIT